MSLNHKEISLILEELALSGYRIQKITQPTHFSLIFHLYKKKVMFLYVNLAQGEARLHSVTNKMPKEEKMMRFVQLLRSRVLGAKIVEASQINENRIVLLKLAKGLDIFHLYIKLWSTAANMILTDASDTIIDVFYRREAKNEVPKACFSLPSKRENEKVFTVREYDTSLSFNEAIEKEYAEHSTVHSLTALREEAERFFNKKIVKLEKIIEQLERKANEFLHCEELLETGHLITSNIHCIKQGAETVRLFDYNKNEEVEVKLDPLKNAQENAQSYYTQYKKALSGYEKVKVEILEYKKEIEELTTRYNMLSSCEDDVVLFRLLDKMKKQDAQSGNKGTEKNCGLSFCLDGWTILVGRSARENDELLRHYVRGSDTWLHTRDYPGGFVFIKGQGANKSVPQNVLIAAGNLAVFYSKARKAGEADLYKTFVKNLRRAKNAPRGTVLPTNEKNMFIKMDASILERLKRCEEVLWKKI